MAGPQQGRALRIAVTGRSGQVATALGERAAADGVEIMALARPDLDLADPAGIGAALKAARPDVVVSAAAYTAVDRAESEPELARTVNADAVAAIGRAAADLGVPVVHLSTDYVFAGDKPTPYVETDPTGPTGVYGATKLAGERALAAATPNHAILRTAWVYAPFGANFVKTMLRVAENRDVVRVVADQRGNPTSALDIAAGIVKVARNLVERPGDADLRGLFHMTGAGSATWADFAEAIFAASAAAGGPTATVERIGTADYPTPARRPANSQLDCSRLERTHGVRLPQWSGSLDLVVKRLIAESRDNRSA